MSTGLHGSERFAPLDGMRAIAAGLVSLWHFQRSVPTLDAALPVWISRAVAHANVGVDVFFVLSGLAVARSLAGVPLDARAIGRFMLRRTVRLDPPYAATVFLVVLLATLWPSWWSVRPTLAGVAAHLFYLQGILSLPNLLGIFWTLCIEIQLYLALAILHLVAQRLRILDVRDGARSDHGFTALVALSAIGAAAYARMPTRLPTDVWLFGWWHVFALGVLVERALRLPATRAWLWGTSLVLLAIDSWGVQESTFVGVAVVGTLMLAARTPLGRVLGARTMSALGGRSYSFYLMHSLVGGMAMHAICARLPQTVGFDLSRLVVGYAAAFGATWLLHRAVEAPAQRWSRRIRVGRRSHALTPKGEPSPAPLPLAS